MSCKTFEDIIIECNQISSRFLSENKNIIHSPEELNSYGLYLRAFCLAVILRLNNPKYDYLKLINNLTMAFSGEMNREEYDNSLKSYDYTYFDKYLYSNHLIVSKIQTFDKNNNTNCWKSYIQVFINILKLIESIEDNSDKKLELFSNEYRELALKMNFGLLEAYTVQKSKDNKENVSHLIEKNYYKHSYIDGEYFVRILIPVICIVVIFLYGLIKNDVVYWFFGCIPGIFLVWGIEKSKSRCPACRAWNSLYLKNSTLIEKNRVKVRRFLGSGYYRRSGNWTLGARQVFVSADEKLYDVVWECRSCGSEFKGKQSAIDDGIR